MQAQFTKFAQNESWTQNPYYGSLGTYFADVTGDGKADAIVVNNDKVTVRRSNGFSFNPNESWTENPYYGSLGTYFADVTGDGKADAIVVNNDKVT
ncbi:FG-GAP repeat domain-containing protein, partial [Nostoc sp.]|uniref:FG-GAP repeat domain-containing protein n=1 Tax=Nostoc sp. TaxID=1180 RepID=UPI002FF4BBBB